ncbi:hypothetical protein FHS78_000430 [Parvibaculum indicum]|uniref:hypothetical protein n=1 Tax=Parvibaculum indicum TaxID=562969 RepID=UPI00141EE789|nr:hypothetical protein [Parvibaculum indicum]NIJ40175.1 hypothetical protein [Parvibaculum indicum]
MKLQAMLCVAAVAMLTGAGPARADSAAMAPVGTALDGPDYAAGRAPVDTQAPRDFQWRITRTAWTESDERAFGDFVTAIGESGCRSFDECLKGPWNIYRASDPKGLFFYADCADLPYMLRGYFAWKNGLPFSYADGVAAVGRSRDLRYSRHGNYVYSRRDFVSSVSGNYPNGYQAMREMANRVSTAMYRFEPGIARGEPFDFYPVEISRAAIRPGTVIYDPNGHVAVVYKVTADGRIRFIDSHPDNSLTRGSYGQRFVRASPGMGAGFKNFRPLTLVGASPGEDGALMGGHVVPASNVTLKDWSAEQFYGNADTRNRSWHAARFLFKGRAMGYYDYVRQAVAAHNVVYDPIRETRLMMRELCDDLHYRVQAVDIALRAGIQERAQPSRLPRNIYGTSGDWETYSTPSRDARLKSSFVELKEQLARFLKMEKEGSERLDYAGGNLAADLAVLYEGEADLCRIAYTRSDTSRRVLSFEDVRQRLFRLSFDPYHCVERRWGAQGAELASCRDGTMKRAWYRAEQRLRNQIERSYETRMDFTLTQLEGSAPGSGVDTPPDTDVLAMLRVAAGAVEAPVVGAISDDEAWLRSGATDPE